MNLSRISSKVVMPCALIPVLWMAPVAGLDSARLDAGRLPSWEERVLAEVSDDPGLPRILLIGDSISMGYTIPVRALLKGKANVHRVRRNAGSTSVGLQRLTEWLGTGKWDVIHFNFGLHDLRWVEGVQPTPPDRYQSNLSQLVQRLKQTQAKLIWASTTPIQEAVNPEPGTILRNDEVKEYNERARKIMIENSIPVDDLYGFALPRLADLQIPDNLHFTARGSEALAGEVARSILSVLGGENSAPGYQLSARRAGMVSSDLIAKVRFEFVPLAPGDFLMGSCHGSGGDKPLPMQLPLHQVQITREFELGKYEVTQAQWQALMGSNPSKFQGLDHPVERVSWEETQAFIRKLNQVEPSHAYRLPSEAEWEYACRAGVASESQAPGDEAWYADNAGQTTHPVGRKQPNSWGFHDMRGNVWEWCQDSYNNGFFGDWNTTDPQGAASGWARIVRGGGIFDLAGLCRHAARFRFVPTERYSFIGFRVAREAR
jgi:formylglycine-generating enzyme required for sulfatase activity